MGSIRCERNAGQPLAAGTSAAGFDADVAVVGLGAMGSHTAWRLAVRGIPVIGVEQFAPGHALGSSAGKTRLFRVACLEHANLVTVARRSRALWQELQAHTADPILQITGGVMIGPADSRVITGTLAAAEAHGLAVERWTRDQLVERFPQHQNLAEGSVGVWDPEAGVVHPEAAIVAAVHAARAAGAEIYPDTRVTAVDLVDGGAVVRTTAGSFTVRQVVVTTGAWLGKLVPGLGLTPMRTPMTWFDPADPADDSFTLDGFPVFIRAVDQDNWIWGHGAADSNGVKIGPDHDDNFTAVDPDRVDRGISAKDHALVSELVSKALPGLNPIPVRISMCMVTHSRDGQFVLGRPRADPRLVVGGGDSGHAFKHASGIGELLAQIVAGEATYVDTAFVDPDRPVAPDESQAR
ncbi:MAG: N-methyl-L-tryptophan oxidase [Pseudonocardiales bacterium]|nr:MAG: N-methyl-L-tryptophan oxidase [Pseudonocardiales bacterium]